MKISLKSSFSIDDQKIISRIIDNQAIIIQLRKRTGTYNAFALNHTGTEIWKLLERKSNVQEIIKILSTKFKIDHNRAEKAIKRFMEELLKRKIIKLN